jgi:anti-sigma B factor antagonist
VGVDASKQGEYQVLQLHGDFRGGTEEYVELRRAGHLALAGGPFLAVDCAHVTFLDSQTLGLLVEMLRASQARGGQVVLVGVTERVRRWFELSGLDRIFKTLPATSELTEKPAPPPEERRGVLDSLDVDRMVSELQEALGEADEGGGPTAPGPVEERMLGEIDRLLKSLGEREKG